MNLMRIDKLYVCVCVGGGGVRGGVEGKHLKSGKCM